jgi:hypothetical protein
MSLIELKRIKQEMKRLGEEAEDIIKYINENPSKYSFIDVYEHDDGRHFRYFQRSYWRRKKSNNNMTVREYLDFCGYINCFDEVKVEKQLIEWNELKTQ